jgi:predicted DCC family thiol-disulfide oxidoreductase YuxK
MGTSDQIENPTRKSIVFFDGYCNLCNGAVNYIIDHDKKKHFLFASLQSSSLISLLGTNANSKLESIIVLTDNGFRLERSDAALFIAKQLGGWSRLFLVSKMFPRTMRDWGYNLIAKHRYSIFGKSETCRMPTSDLKERFLDTFQNI